MKKLFKRKRSVGSVQAGPDIASLMDKIQRQLVSLERKVDTLISESSGRPTEMPFKGRNFSKPSRSFGRSYGQGKGRQDNISRERSFTKVVCAECSKECEVPFKPSADRPVYCRECFAKRKGASSFGKKRDNSFGDENREFKQKKKPFFRRRK
ncbi:MAG: CxxC-x17-CxxC domain-containing protein [Candidatus Omnitrophota bacterium]